MSEQAERVIKDWFEHTGIAKLQYLDLADNTTPTPKHLAHNLEVIYNCEIISTRIIIRDYFALKEKIRELKQDINSLKEKCEEQHREVIKEIRSLKRGIEISSPISPKEVRSLFQAESSKQQDLNKIPQQLEEIRAILDRMME